MAKVKIMTAAEAAAQVPDGAVINTEGFVQAGLSETLNRALEERFLETGHPRDLTIFTVAGQGCRNTYRRGIRARRALRQKDCPKSRLRVSIFAEKQ